MIITARTLVLCATILMTSTTFAHNDKKDQEVNPIFRKSWTMLARVNTQNFQETFKLLSNKDIDIAGVNIDKKQIDVLITESDYYTLVNLGLSPVISETKGVSRGPDDEYQNPQEVEDFLFKTSQNFPDLTQLVSIGKSIEGRDIWALKISDNADLDESDEPAVLFNSMHHAREVMGPEVGLDIVDYLLSRYSTDSEVSKWVNSTEIWVMPMFNVDGNYKMWSKDSWWRKNTRDGHGVDLNRNYPAGWDSCNGSSGRRSSQTYRGPNPASEPETKAMMKFIGKTRPVFDISYHSYSELVIYPYGCASRRTQTQDVVESIGKEIASLLGYKAGTAWELLYNADGGDIDWMYDAYQVIPYVIELNSTSEGFHPKYNKWRDKTVQLNRAGWQHLLNRVHESGLRGTITKISENSEVAAYANQEITVYKKLSSGALEEYQTYKTHQNGMFHLVLNPGTYVIKADGKSFEHQVTDTLAQINISI